MSELSSAHVQVPNHVVHRSFVSETVVLNLRTGKYHGLNPTAGRMLSTLEELGSVPECVDRLAREYGRTTEDVERDLLIFLRSLLDRELIEPRDDQAQPGDHRP